MSYHTFLSVKGLELASREGSRLSVGSDLYNRRSLYLTLWIFLPSQEAVPCADWCFICSCLQRDREATADVLPWQDHGRGILPYLCLDSAFSSLSWLQFSSDSIYAGIPSPFRGDPGAIAWSLPAIFPCGADNNAGNILCRLLVSGLHFLI